MAKSLALTATGQIISASRGSLKAIIVSSHTSGTIRLVDAPNGTSGRELINTWTLASGPQVIDLHNMEFYEGVYAFVGGTLDAKLVYNL